jgi:hypothetical protein
VKPVILSSWADRDTTNINCRGTPLNSPASPMCTMVAKGFEASHFSYMPSQRQLDEPEEGNSKVPCLHLSKLHRMLGTYLSRDRNEGTKKIRKVVATHT